MNFELYKRINDEKLGFGIMPDATVAHAYKNNACGDDYVIYLKVQGDRIQDASYTTNGCGFGLVALAMATQLVKGKTLEEAESITASDIEAAFAFPEKRRSYPEIAAQALRQTVQEAKRIKK